MKNKLNPYFLDNYNQPLPVLNQSILIRSNQLTPANHFYLPTSPLENFFDNNLPTFMKVTAKNGIHVFSTGRPGQSWSLFPTFSLADLTQGFKASWSIPNPVVFQYTIKKGDVFAWSARFSYDLAVENTQIFIPNLEHRRIKAFDWTEFSNSNFNSHLEHFNAFNVHSFIWERAVAVPLGEMIYPRAEPVHYFMGSRSKFSSLLIKEWQAPKNIPSYQYSLKQPNYKMSTQAVGSWLVKKSFVEAYDGLVAAKNANVILAPTMPWRPGIYDSKKANPFKRINYSNLWYWSQKVITPPLMLHDIYQKTKDEFKQFGNYSVPAKLLAVSSDIMLDCAMFALGWSVGLPLHISCVIANDIRNVQPEDLNKREYLLSSLLCYEYNDHYIDEILEKFDQDPLCREANLIIENALYNTKLSYKPFELLYDVKKAVVDYTRDMGDWINDSVIDMINSFAENQINSKQQQIAESHDPLTVSTDDLKQTVHSYQFSSDIKLTHQYDGLFLKADPLVKSSHSHLRDILFHQQSELENTDTHTTLPLENEETKEKKSEYRYENMDHELMSSSKMNQEVKFLETSHPAIQTTSEPISRVEFDIDCNNMFLEEELHHFLNGINDKKDAEEIEVEEAAEIKTPLVNEEKYKASYNQGNMDAPKTNQTPLIKNIYIGTVGGGIGIIATLANGCEIGLTASKSSFLVTISSAFSPGHLSGFLAATGIGAIVATVFLSVNYFYQRNIRRNERRIKNSLKRAREEGLTIQSALESLDNKLNQPSNLTEILHDSSVVMQQIETHTQKELSRAHTAIKKHCSKARDAHLDQAIHLESCYRELSILSKKLALCLVQQQFVELYKYSSNQNLTQLAHDLLGKNQFSQDDIAKIHGLKHLITHRIAVLAQKGHYEDAHQLLLATTQLTYHPAGDLHALNFGEGLGKISQKIEKQISDINKNLESINELLDLGENPVSKIHEVKDLLRKINEDWAHEQDKRRKRHGRTSSHYVTKEQWKKRIEILNTLINQLNEKIQLYSAGVPQMDLGLGHLLDLSQRYLNDKHQPLDYWLKEIEKVKNNKIKNEDEILFIKAACSEHLISYALNTAIQGKFEEAISVFKKLSTFISEFDDFAKRHISKLLELAPFEKEKACFWIERIKTIHNQTTKAETDNFELMIAQQLCLNEMIRQAVIGKFIDAKKIINELVSVLPADEKEAFTAFLSPLDNIERHYHRIDDCIEILKYNQEKPEEQRQLADTLEFAVVNQMVINEMMHCLIKCHLELAKKYCLAYQQAVPENRELADHYLEAIEKLSLLDSHDNNLLLSRLESLNLDQIEESDSSKALVIHCIHEWVMNNVLGYVLQGDYPAAVKDLQNLELKDPTKKQLSQHMILLLNEAQRHAEESVHYWLQYYNESNRYYELHEGDREDLATSNMRRVIALGVLFRKANHLSHLGYHQKAAGVMESLQVQDSNLSLIEVIEDFNFAHEGQIAGVFADSIKKMISTYLFNLPKSQAQKLLILLLEAFNSMQILLPHLPGLCLQGIIAPYRYTGDIFVRNLQKNLQQLHSELNIFKHLDFSRVETLVASTKNIPFSALYIYYQLGLKGIQHLPLKDILPQKYAFAKVWSNRIIVGGQLFSQAISFYSSAKQLLTARAGHMSAYFPIHCVIIANTLLKLFFEGVRHLSAHGKEKEDLRHYFLEESIYSMVNIAGTSAFLALITGGLSSTFYAGSAILGASEFHHLLSSNTNNNHLCKALSAALNNVKYYQHIHQEYYFLPSCHFKLLNRTPTQEELQEVLNRKAIIISQSPKYDVVYFKSLYVAEIQQKFFEKGFHLLERLPWPKNSQSINLNKSTDNIKHFIAKMHYLYQVHLSKTPLVSDYLSSCKKIFLIEGEPAGYVMDTVEDGLALCISRNTKKDQVYFHLHYLNKCDKCISIEIKPESAWFDMLYFAKTILLTPETNQYYPVFNYCLENIIKANLQDSKMKIVQLLNDSKGFCFEPESENENVFNTARLTLFQLHSQELFENERCQSLLNYTKLIHKENNDYLHEDFQIPVHLGWQTVILRLLAHLKKPELLAKFQKQYEEYSSAIFKMAKQNQTWFNNNIRVIKENLHELLTMGIQQLVIEASKSAQQQQLIYLKEILAPYDHSTNVWQLMLSDNHKFLAASLCFQLNEFADCKTFLSRIDNLQHFLVCRNQQELTDEALIMLERIDSDKYELIFLQALENKLAINEQMIQNFLFKLIERKEFQKIDIILAIYPHFSGSQTVKAACVFMASSKKIEPALMELAQEKKRDLAYWQLIYKMLGLLLSLNSEFKLIQKHLNNKAILLSLMVFTVDKICQFNPPQLFKEELLKNRASALIFIQDFKVFKEDRHDNSYVRFMKSCGGNLSHLSENNIINSMRQIAKEINQFQKNNIGFFSASSQPASHQLAEKPMPTLNFSFNA